MFLFLSLDTLHICSMKGEKKQYFFDQAFFFFNILVSVPRDAIFSSGCR